MKYQREPLREEPCLATFAIAAGGADALPNHTLTAAEAGLASALRCAARANSERICCAATKALREAVDARNAGTRCFTSLISFADQTNNTHRFPVLPISDQWIEQAAIKQRRHKRK